MAEELRRHLPGCRSPNRRACGPSGASSSAPWWAIMNAFVLPLMDDYLGLLVDRVAEVGVAAPIYITANNGGTLSIETARDRPIETILSGPASGVVAATRVAAEAGHEHIITVDMGGTSCDVAVTKGSEPEYSMSTHVGDYPLVLPVVNVSAIGAGGGSVIWVDPQGVLKVGPAQRRRRSGPGLLRARRDRADGDRLLPSGGLHPPRPLSRRAHDVGPGRGARGPRERRRQNRDRGRGPGGEGRRGGAAGDHRHHVDRALQGVVAARRGPARLRDHGLRGAGPTQANLLAEEAQLETVVIPAAPSTFCAMGAILADVKRDYVRSRHLRFADGNAAVTQLAEIFRSLEAEASAWIETEGDILGETGFQATADMRYKGEAFDLQVAIPDDLRTQPDADGISELFHREHELIYGFRDLESGVEVTTERVRVTGKIPPITLPEAGQARETQAGVATARLPRRRLPRRSGLRARGPGRRGRDRRPRHRRAGRQHHLDPCRDGRRAWTGSATCGSQARANSERARQPASRAGAARPSFGTRRQTACGLRAAGRWDRARSA